MHDNWIHKLCISVGGFIYYDIEPHIYYRQHDNNVVGSRSTIISRTKRHIHSVFKNRCYRSNSIAELYKVYQNEMTDENKKICYEVTHYRKGLNRFKIILDKGYRTQNKRVNTVFIFAVLLGVY